VLDRFGISSPDLDGVVALPVDPFDSLIGKVQPRADETDVPVDVLGWTHTAPTGWTIDNADLGTGGVREWRGWSFTTDDFWTRAAPNQIREGNVRARGVFAVTDSDEWSDLRAPRHPCPGRRADLEAHLVADQRRQRLVLGCGQPGSEDQLTIGSRG
jgi:hypothetical protein